MAQALHSLVRHIRTMAGLPRTRESSDRQLLERFVAGEESAFAALVQRHGALVLGVCRRVLQNGHDAEDAFQATFLVLAKKAASVGWKDSIGNWLHAVAYRIAMKTRAGEIRRRMREQKAAAENPKEKSTDINWSDLRRVLDEELARLPARYRAPLLLCYLEGKTRDEAAQELGWSAGSVKGRLERGREILRARLARRGLALSAVLCASLLPESAASAAIPATLAATTVQAGMQFITGQAAGVVSAQVLSLTQGVLHAMLWTRIKITTVLVLAISALGIGGAITHQSLASSTGSAADHTTFVSQSFAPDPALVFQDEPRERGKEERGKEIPQVRGQIKDVDAAKGTITVFPRGPRGEPGRDPKTYNLANKDVKVVTNFESPAKLTDLKEGMLATLSLSPEMDVIGIRVDNPVISGILKPVEAKLRIILNLGRGDDMEFKVDPDAKFALNGKPAAFLDFKEGMRVTAYLALDRSTVVALSAGQDRGRRAGGSRDKGGRDTGNGRDVRRATADITGVIVNIHKNSIDVLIGTDDLKIESYELAKDFVIQAQGHEPSPGKMTDLAKAIRVGLKLSEDKKTVARIDVTYPVLRGTIVAVDAGKKTITLGSADKTLLLAKDAKILIDGKAGTIADLGERTPAVVTLSLDRSQVMGIVVGNRPAGRR
jgi:RNA polymerase sigma factor (sigma-70 family)